ncbi:glutathione S-transferase theta-1-like [Odocoileus virginianus]|uniref:Glutathione S-transferase theta-1-like n=1 Tax=Odocoileus virginianus TaxID=9874 RepID=A0ABM4ISH0_ODOVR
MDAELFLDLSLPPCHTTYIFTKKSGIRFELRPVELAPWGEQSQCGHPLYLSHKYQTEAHWYPPELQACTRVDEYLAWQHSASQQPAANTLPCLLPHFSGQPMDTAQVEQLLGKLMPTLGHLDQELLATRPFLASGQVSLADLMAFTELMQTGPGLPRGEPVWRLPWAPSSSRRPIGVCFSAQEAQHDPQMAQKLAQQVKKQLH